MGGEEGARLLVKWSLMGGSQVARKLVMVVVVVGGMVSSLVR
jgi:hypothetical protein